MPELSEMSIQALRMRQKLGRFIMRKIRRDWHDEEGAAEAIAKYDGQVRRITEELRRRRIAQRERLGEEKPADKTVTMKVASLGATTPKPGSNGALVEKLRKELEKAGMQVKLMDKTQEVKDGGR